MEWKEYLEEAKSEFIKRMNAPENLEVNINDFFYIRSLGKGKFGRVMLFKNKYTGTDYAIKFLKNEFTEQNYKLILNEKEILKSIYFPFTVNLVSYFYHDKHLYLVLPLVECGDLFRYLQKKRNFSEILSKFYGAQVLLALEYLHYLDLVYRDLKPENILLDRRGYIRLTDFGLCKKVKDRTYTFCGTAEYIAPEIINNKGYGKHVDYWSFGVLLYEMRAGFTPFYADSPRKVFQNIIDGEYQQEPSFSNDLKNLIEQLLKADITLRYGGLNGGVKDIKEHDWFKQIYWVALFNKLVTPPSLPCLEQEDD